MKIRIIFDGKEHHEYETNEFEDSFLLPPAQPYCVRRILDTIESQLMIPVPNPILTAQEQNTPRKMNTLTIVIPYHTKDLESARRLLNWIHEIGTRPYHSCMLVADAGVEKKDRDDLKENAARSFAHVGTLPVNVLPVGFAPNQMFLAAARQIQSTQKLPWLWLEPDCVPLRLTWADTIADAYAEVPQKFMGPIVHSTKPGMPATHLTGCSVYPPDAFSLYDTVESLKGQNVAWDIESANLIVPRACDTYLIQHHWGEAGWPPTFVMHKQDGTAYAKNVVDMSFIKPESQIFHRCKDESLMNMLRLQRQSQKIAERPVVEVKRGPGRPPKSTSLPAPVSP